MGVPWSVGNLVCHILPFHHFAENRVAIVEPRRWSYGDKELAAIRVGTGIGHRQLASLGVLQKRMEFVGEFVAWISGASAARAATLDHELGNDAVKRQPIIKIPLHFLSIGNV